ncbi:MAG: NAD(P)/FAD-dependent oxidoreductase [Lachnospiraceae bacterium]|nr:NAD(P)/FAD-dependent oxidoreductase [Lachnospiraceae bacterium]
MSRVIVVGGGAAGMMAALAAAEKGCRVCLIEKNEKLGKKLFITGKGRCNVTNAADMETLFANVRSNAKFLYSAFYDYDNRAVMDFLEKAGCFLKIERGERVFPVSDHSSDVIAAFQRELKKRKVEVLLNTEVKELLLEAGEEAQAEAVQERGGEAGQVGAAGSCQKEGQAGAAGSCQKAVEAGAAGSCQKAGQAGASGSRMKGVRLSNGKTLYGDSCIVCTGGISYPSTGSTGDGYRFAENAGHQVTQARPSLVPFNIKEKWCARLMGLSLKNVSLRMICDGREVYEGFGEMLFTHFGVSGPLVLSASSFYGVIGGKGKKKARGYGETEADTKLYIDLKPALDLEQLDRRLLRDFEANKGKQFKNALGGLFPASLIPVMVELSGIHPERKVNEVTREERRSFAALIKNLPLTVTGVRGFEEAIITRGGVSVREVHPSTMESKKVKGLYFAGEVLDVDALTGGYNLQIAWSTGHLAGSSQ